MAHFLRQIGGLAFVLGVLAIILNFMNMVPKLLVWIYFWWDQTAWIIKVAFVIGWALIWFAGMKLEPAQPHETDMNPESLK